MTKKLNLKSRIIFTVLIFLLIWGHVIWDYFHGGIPTHYLFHDANMPGFPNWLGAIILPFFVWFLLHRIQKRIDKDSPKDTTKKIVLRFLAAALVAITIAVCFTKGIEIPPVILLSILGLGLFFPLYNSEFLLGWVLGSSFTFGAIIPMGFGSLFALICFILFTIGRLIWRLLSPKK